MKTITLSAEERLIDYAREEAHEHKITLNQLFRGWLEELAAGRERRRQLTALFGRLEHVNTGGKFSRETMNEH